MYVQTKMKMKKKMPSSFFFFFSTMYIDSLTYLNEHLTTPTCQYHRVASFLTKSAVVVKFLNKYSSNMFMLLFLLIFSRPCSSQLVGSERTMEQFLDRLLHESVYDRRIRPFYTDSKSKINYSKPDSSLPIIYSSRIFIDQMFANIYLLEN